jgi:capsular polysaccharide biosynthesis protein
MRAASERTEPAELTDYAGVLRRRWWIITCLTLVGIAASAAYLLLAPKAYTATAGVEVNPTAVNSSSQQQAGAAKTAVNMDNESQLAQSATVAAIAVKLLHSPLTPSELSSHISVSIPPNSQLLEISCTASSATEAATCANAIADAYLQNRTATATKQINSEIAQLNVEAKSLLSQIADLKIKMNSLPPNDPTAAGDAALSAEDSAKLHTLASEEAVLQAELGSSSSSYVATKATPPTKPSSPSKKLVLPSGTIVGLLLGLMLAVVVDRRDKLVRSESYLDRQLDLPILLNMPRLKLKPQVALATSRSRAGRACSELAHTVTTILGNGNHIVMIASTAPGPGAGVVAANFAAAVTRTYSDATLVCADLRDAVEPQLFGVREGPGLAEVLTGSARVNDVARQSAEIPRLEVIGPGLDETVVLYEMRHDTGDRLARSLRQRAGYVVIEAPTAGESPDAFALAPFVDAVIVVVEMQRTTRADLAACMKHFEMLRVPVLGGVVLPKFPARSVTQAHRGSQPEPAQPRDPAARPRPDSRSQSRTPEPIGPSSADKARPPQPTAEPQPPIPLDPIPLPSLDSLGAQEKEARHHPTSKDQGTRSAPEAAPEESAGTARGM